MFLWVAAGYVLSAIAFYSYIVATAQEEPQQNSVTLREWTESQRQQEQSQRKAA